MSSFQENSDTVNKCVKKKRDKRRCAYCGAVKEKTTNKRFYGFPKDEETCKKWAEKVKHLRRLSLRTLRNYHVCSDHFLPEDFSSGLRYRLKPNVFPRSLDELPLNIPLIKEQLKSKLVGNSCESNNLSFTILENNEKQQSTNGALNVSFLREKLNSKLHANITASDSPEVTFSESDDDPILGEIPQIDSSDDEDVNVPLLKEKLKAKLMGNSSEPFKKWKAEMERKTLCSFTLRHGTKKGVLGARYFYSCHRSGKYAPKRKGPRQRMIKLQGSCKMGICCTAAIQAQETPNGVMVKFCPYHYGHGKETTYIKLTPEERVAIEESVEKGVPFETLLSEIRENKSSKDHFQLFLLKKKDIRSINNSYAYEEFNTEMSDADSVDRWISLCCQMEVSPILFYQKEDFVGGEGKHDEFLLVIMTEFQRQILLNSARQIVCVDSLYRKKGGRFYLTVMFIMDEMDLAFPVAFCISNKVDKMVLIQFYASISQQTGPLECQYFMSDSESHYYEAWKEVMNDESKWIWSLWYVDSRFRTQLKIFKGDTQKRQDVYKVLRVLLECPNQIVFTCMFENLIKDLMASPTSKDLGKFIQSKYGSNFEMWARCYQKDIELGTVIHLEIMHRTLRYCCREGRKTRLDKFIYVLMKLIRDKMLDRLSNVLDEEKITMAVEAINTCHTMGLEIVPENITVLSDKIWLVRAENPDENAYVTVDNATCLEHCNLKCIECDICVHMYSCTCLNNLINANMCDHIHAVVYNFITPHFSPPASDVDDIMQEVADTGSEVVEMFQKEESYEELLQSVLKRSHQVYKLIQASRNSLNSSSLTKLLNKMNDCVDICTGKYKEPEPPKFPPAVPTFPFPVVSSVPRPAASLPTACRSMPSNGTSLPRSPAPVPFSSASSSSSGPTPSTSTAPVSLLSPNPTNPTQPGAVAVTNINSAPGGKPVYVLQPVYGNNASVAPTQILQGPFLRGPQGQIIQASNIVQSATGGQYIVVMQDKAK